MGRANAVRLRNARGADRCQAAPQVMELGKPVLSPLNFPPDWQKILLDRIDAELASRRWARPAGRAHTVLSSVFVAAFHCT